MIEFKPEKESKTCFSLKINPKSKNNETLLAWIWPIKNKDRDHVESPLTQRSLLTRSSSILSFESDSSASSNSWASSLTDSWSLLSKISSSSFHGSLRCLAAGVLRARAADLCELLTSFSTSNWSLRGAKAGSFIQGEALDAGATGEMGGAMLMVSSGAAVSAPSVWEETTVEPATAAVDFTGWPVGTLVEGCTPPSEPSGREPGGSREGCPQLLISGPAAPSPSPGRLKTKRKIKTDKIKLKRGNNWAYLNVSSVSGASSAMEDSSWVQTRRTDLMALWAFEVSTVARSVSSTACPPKRLQRSRRTSENKKGIKK